MEKVSKRDSQMFWLVATLFALIILPVLAGFWIESQRDYKRTQQKTQLKR